jgi:hypothetical protein
MIQNQIIFVEWLSVIKEERREIMLLDFTRRSMEQDQSKERCH